MEYVKKVCSKSVTSFNELCNTAFFSSQSIIRYIRFFYIDKYEDIDKAANF